MEGCCCKCNKYVLFAFNFLFAIGGLTILVIGAIVYANLNEFNNVFDSDLYVSSIVLITAGSVVFTIGFFGCFGAIRESICLLNTYSALLAVVLVLLIAGTVLAFLMVANADTKILTSLNNFFESDPESDTWDTLHTKFECCGVNGTADWDPNPIPDSCKCQETTDSSLCIDGYYSEGCYDRIYSFFLTLEIVIGVMALIFSLAALSGIFFSCLLSGAIKTKTMHV